MKPDSASPITCPTWPGLQPLTHGRLWRLRLLGCARPFDKRWSNRCTGRVPLGVSEAQPADEHSRCLSGRQDLGRDAIEHDFGPPEHCKASWLLDDTPRQVYESATGRSRDVRPPEVGEVGGHRSRLQLPGDGFRVRAHLPHQLAWLVFPLYADLDPVMAVRTVRRRPTGPAREVVRLDADQHATSMRHG
jgi:hypothetical protein